MQSILNKYPKELIQKARSIKALVTDVDGVLTDGKITYDANGVETKSFNVKDGLIVSKLRACGIKVGLITGRQSSIVEKRSMELGFDFFYQASKDKIKDWESIKSQYGLKNEEIAYLGDDLNDLKLLVICGLGSTPADGPDYIKERVDLVSHRKGGEGVFREVAELILAAQGEFDKFLDI